MDFNRDEVDVAIRFGTGAEPELYSKRLADEWVTPVMTPELAQEFSTLDALERAPLIHDESMDFFAPRCDWPIWFRAVGRSVDPTYVARFSQADHSVDAALAGVGVTLGRRS